MKTVLLYYVLVPLLYVSVAAGIIYLAIKRTWLFLILLGVAAMLAALPLAYLVEFGVNGCCGAPRTGYEGVGFVAGALMAVAGIVLIIVGARHKRRKMPK